MLQGSYGAEIPNFSLYYEFDLGEQDPDRVRGKADRSTRHPAQGWTALIAEDYLRRAA
jgi:hypothetical protein